MLQLSQGAPQTHQPPRSSLHGPSLCTVLQQAALSTPLCRISTAFAGPPRLKARVMLVLQVAPKKSKTILSLEAVARFVQVTMCSSHFSTNSAAPALGECVDQQKQLRWG